MAFVCTVYYMELLEMILTHVRLLEPPSSSVGVIIIVLG